MLWKKSSSRFFQTRVSRWISHCQKSWKRYYFLRRRQKSLIFPLGPLIVDVLAKIFGFLRLVTKCSNCFPHFRRQDSRPLEDRMSLIDLTKWKSICQFWYNKSLTFFWKLYCLLLGRRPGGGEHLNFRDTVELLAAGDRQSHWVFGRHIHIWRKGFLHEIWGRLATAAHFG